MAMNVSKILIIIQRSNGDVFLSSPLINALYAHYNKPQIDLLVNDDTLAIAKTLNHINNIHLFSYKKKKENPILQEINIIKDIYKKYDLSVNLTSSDRSVLYAVLASKYPISAIQMKASKEWWKKLLLKRYYFFDKTQHILKKNTMSLKLLNIPNEKIIVESNCSQVAKEKITQKLQKLNIDKFLIFHPSAQYNYKIYPEKSRNKLLTLLNDLSFPIIITGSKNRLDAKIKSSIPKLDNIYDFIGETSLEEYISLSQLSCGYVGMDTLNMHIAASQNKRIFAIFGPTILSIWSPWSNNIQVNATTNKPQQTYGNITIFQADMECVACGKAGCDDRHGKSDCLDKIKPEIIFKEVEKWLMEFQ